eukprot:TRINITY_DN3770_c0_g1_i1.p1 TRINITY_DN3770_c0_g1~~TRINITY_DN3770_c0_g1_i1.p1  ORF type:complete len:551 (-),score=135.98 TRINITY_DN3770_c0_g1_i1:134-1786(-)
MDSKMRKIESFQGENNKNLDIKEKSLIINVIKAKNLPSADSNGFSDPYFKINLNNETIYKSKTIKKSLEPTWEEGITINTEAFTSVFHMTIQIYDWNLIKKHTLLGEINFLFEVTGKLLSEKISLNLQMNEKINKDFELSGTNGSLLSVSIQPIGWGQEIEIKEKSPEEKTVENWVPLSLCSTDLQINMIYPKTLQIIESSRSFEEMKQSSPNELGEKKVLVMKNAKSSYFVDEDCLSLSEIFFGDRSLDDKATINWGIADEGNTVLDHLFEKCEVTMKKYTEDSWEVFTLFENEKDFEDLLPKFCDGDSFAVIKEKSPGQFSTEIHFFFSFLIQPFSSFHFVLSLVRENRNNSVSSSQSFLKAIVTPLMKNLTPSEEYLWDWYSVEINDEDSFKFQKPSKLKPRSDNFFVSKNLTLLLDHSDLKSHFSSDVTEESIIEYTKASMDKFKTVEDQTFTCKVLQQPSSFNFQKDHKGSLYSVLVDTNLKSSNSNKNALILQSFLSIFHGPHLFHFSFLTQGSYSETEIESLHNENTRHYYSKIVSTLQIIKN